MKYNPQIHHRRSTRLKGYDFSQAGLYFITICCHNRQCFFGHIENGKMFLNEIGKIANECWLGIPQHYPNAVLHEHIVMPNHFHGIIELTDMVWTRHGVSITDNAMDTAGTRHGVSQQDNTINTVGTSHGMSQPSKYKKTVNQFGKPIRGSVSVIINQYKSSVKRWCNKNGGEYFEWQSRFHDHIIRNEKSYQTISQYIINNPAKWNGDKFFSTNKL